MARYVRIRLANGDSRHVTLPQDETHTQWAAREFVAESRWAQTVEGTLVAKASTSSCPSSTRRAAHARRRVARAGGDGSAGARVFLSETLRDEPNDACEATPPGYRSD